MRVVRKLQDQWWVSISEKDAVLAAMGGKWDAAALECAGDPENHPRCIDLPGGPQFGKRPLAAAAGAVAAMQAITESFVGPSLGKDARGERLPNPFLVYARRVAVPAAWQGNTILLHLDNVRYNVTVAIDGTVIERYVGGLEPHHLDITSRVTPGHAALLTITVGDSGTSGHRCFDAYNFTGTRLPTCKELENNLVHPVNYGGSDRAVGKVTLEAVPAVHVDHVFADPKVLRGVLRLTVALVNDTDRRARVRVSSEVPGAKRLVDEVVSLAARSRKSITREIAWPDARVWDTDDPHLYRLQTTLRAAGGGLKPETRNLKPRKPAVIDKQIDTFGFREFTINGHSFYLNGRKIHLHGQSGHTSPDRDALLPLREKMRILRAWKEEGNVSHIRLHAKPQDKGWVEAADRVGMLITTETALWTTGFHSFDWAGSEQACTANVRNHFLEALVRRDRNCPSVVIWSLSNEMSPITPFDMENPKMAAMTRAFEKIIAEAEAEDSSRVIQMSSAMDFVGRLKMYNLHYPKNWQAFPDYPHTAYWLDSSFLFPWYGPRRAELPSWSWRKDKPLYFGEFTCVFGATPDNQASVVGDTAFEQPDFGTALVNEKLWPMEIHAYRRLDVSGFCAWACMCFTSYADTRKALRLPATRAHTRAIRPVAVLHHTYRRRWFARDEVALELSIHNDTRHALDLALACEVRDGRRVLWQASMPAATCGPAEIKAFTLRYRAPDVSAAATLQFHAELTCGAKVMDRWSLPLAIAPRREARAFPVSCAVYDVDGSMAERFAARGMVDARFVDDLAAPQALQDVAALWVNFGEARLHAREWQRVLPVLRDFVRGGGRVILDGPPPFACEDLPVRLKNGKGYAEGERLEITYAYSVAPHHPVMRGMTDEDFSLWGKDYYIAHRCFAVPQEGNALPLLVAGTDRGGLTSTPLLELRDGRGAWLVTTLELVPKLGDEPLAAELMLRIATGSGGQEVTAEGRAVPASTGVSVTAETLRVLREVGFAGRALDTSAALESDLAIVDGANLDPATHMPALRTALQAGRTVYLHDLGEDATRALLSDLSLPGTVAGGAAGAREYDVVRHTCALMDGVTNNYLYWIVDKSKVAPWTLAPMHPAPASALIALPARIEHAASMTRRGAVTAYSVGAGRLVIDNLRWQEPGFDEPERPRRYVMTMLTNLGAVLTAGAAKRMSEEFETDAERRERGHF